MNGVLSDWDYRILAVSRSQGHQMRIYIRLCCEPIPGFSTVEGRRCRVAG